MRIVAAQGDLQLGAQDRERRAQLMTGVIDERSLARERRLVAREHLVERLSQSPQFIARPRDGQALAGVGDRQRLRTPA